MMFVEHGLYVVIEQLETTLAPLPKPLNHGFSTGVAYLVLGAFSLSESGDAYFILSNDDNQIWFISNRHLRTYKLLRDSSDLRLRLQESVDALDPKLHTNGRSEFGRAETSAPLRGNGTDEVSPADF
ncbi:MAG: hypothetical protein ACR2NX_10630 [Chthoniobacterales bacterium]